MIYDRPDTINELSPDQKYRFVPYDPTRGIDFTWEREWRLRGEHLALDPRQTLVVVPTADEAFDLAYRLADMEADYDRDGFPGSAYHVPRWLCVSSDLFGFER